MRSVYVVVFCAMMPLVSFAQVDSVEQLNEVVVSAYEYGRSNLEVPAAVNVVDTREFERFSNTSLVPAMNTLPGVRMEERSPGSYRFSLRGSSLRSPFGVRNVKVYWNGLPLTDAGGNTYINQLESSLISEAEIIKGPGSSVYGAGTGGVILLKGLSARPNSKLFNASVMGGSYGLFKATASANIGTENGVQAIYFGHQQSDGYRNQTKMQRDIAGWNGSFTLNDQQTLSATIFASHLYYQTPGGLTEQQMLENPRMARPGSETNQAAVDLRSFYTGVSHRWKLSDKWENTTGLYGNGVKFENPSLRNVEHRTEMYAGGRSVTRYSDSNIIVNFGGEFQYSYVPSRTYDNENGFPGALQQDDELSASFYMLFAQIEVPLPAGLNLSGGLSFNSQAYSFQRLSDPVPTFGSVTYDPVLAPRIALQRTFNETISVYASFSQGFSPPSYAEVYPSEGTFSSDLNAEKGINLETGAKAILMDGKLSATMSLYRFNLDETIVVRRTVDDAEYFVNAGETKQDGIEVLVEWKSSAYNPFLVISGSYTYNNYVFQNYIKESDDFSGNKLPGVPENTVVVKADVFRGPFYLNTTLQHTSSIFLNDANAAKADPYTLLSARLGWRWNKRAELFAGADNLLDVSYSLGNDLNAFGGRYFNPAPGRNYFAGLRVTFGE